MSCLMHIPNLLPVVVGAAERGALLHRVRPLRGARHHHLHHRQRHVHVLRQASHCSKWFTGLVTLLAK